MIDKIDISSYPEESYILNDNIEILFNEEGIFILSSEGIVEIKDLEKDVTIIGNSFIFINKEDEFELVFNEEEYNIIKKLFQEKLKK